MKFLSPTTLLFSHTINISSWGHYVKNDSNIGKNSCRGPWISEIDVQKYKTKKII